VADKLADGEFVTPVSGGLAGIDEIAGLSGDDTELGVGTAELPVEGVFEAGRVHNN